jgi:cation transport regulator ChaC
MSDEDYETIVRNLLFEAPPGPTWLFAIGSLLWKPACEVATSQGVVRAIGFTANRQDQRYAGKLPLDKVADVLATAAGHWGSCAEYLYETVAHLEQLGIHDRNLWRLQRLVAERIKKIAD